MCMLGQTSQGISRLTPYVLRDQPSLSVQNHRGCSQNPLLCIWSPQFTLYLWAIKFSDIVPDIS